MNTSRVPPVSQRRDAHFTRTLIGNALVPIISAALLGALLVGQAVILGDQASWVQHSQQVLTADYRVANVLNRMESGQRGFMVSKDLRFRRPYEESRAEIIPAIQALANLVTDNPWQLPKARELQTMMYRWDTNAKREMDLAAQRDPGFEHFFKNSGGAAMMDRMRKLCDDIREEEARLRFTRQAKLDRQTRIATLLGLGGLLLTLIFFALFSVRQYRILNAQHQSNVAALADQREELRDLYEQLRHQNEDLEDRVLARTEELRVAKEEAESASEAKSMFLANMSHELRTPLNAILGYSEMLAEDAEDAGTTEMVPDLKKINSAGKHLLGLINDILDLAKIEAGKVDLFMEDVDPLHLLREIAETVGPLATSNQNLLVLELPDALPLMRTDVQKIRQTFFNLLSNAAKFTSGGTITLGAKAETDASGTWLLAWVKDTGIGMNDEQAGRIFGEFTQADASTTRKYGGTGLGLAISLRFCQLLGGNILVESVLGTGSMFTVRLPLQAPEVASEIVVERARSGQPNVLVVDDDPRARELITRYLSREGYHVIAAEAGSEGLRLAREHRPDAILLDVIMPGLDGWSVLTALKADPDLANTPVVMATMLDDRSLGFSLGAADFLVKPIERVRLLGTLRRILDGSAAGPILVVDDDRINRDLLRALLGREGYEVEEACDGVAALARVEARRPAVVILDLLMPVMDGFAFVSEVRRRPHLAGIPIIVLTALDLGADEVLGLARSVQGVLAKAPADQESLLVGLKAQLDKVLKPARPEGVDASP